MQARRRRPWRSARGPGPGGGSSVAGGGGGGLGGGGGRRGHGWRRREEAEPAFFFPLLSFIAWQQHSSACRLGALVRGKGTQRIQYLNTSLLSKMNTILKFRICSHRNIIFRYPHKRQEYPEISHTKDKSMARLFFLQKTRGNFINLHLILVCVSDNCIYFWTEWVRWIHMGWLGTRRKAETRPAGFF
jgi:hypothetical protein